MVFIDLVLKEIRNNLLTLRFTIILCLLFVLTVSSMALMAANYRAQTDKHRQNTAQQNEAIEQVSSSSDLRWRGLSGYVPPTELTVLALGLDREMSRARLISSRGGVEKGASQYSNPVFSLFTAPDLTYVVNIVLSLIALFFAFDAICGEYEAGTLSLCMANPVPRDLIILGKWFGGYLTVAVAFIFAFIAGLCVSFFIARFQFTGEEWLRLISILGLMLLYIALYYSMGLFISTLNHKSSTALMVSLFIWVGAVLALPNITPMVAKQIVKVPSHGELAAQKRQIERDEWNKAREQMRTTTDNQQRRRLHTDVRQQVNERWGRVQQEYENLMDRQIHMATILARLSPSSSFIFAATDLAGTGKTSYEDLRQYEDVFLKQFSDAARLIAQEEGGRRGGGRHFGGGQSDTRSVDTSLIPKFSFDRSGLSFKRSLNTAATDITLLLGYCVFFFLAGYMAFIKYDMVK